MSGSLLVAYASKRGSTHEVAEAVAARLAEHGYDVTVSAARAVGELDDYDGVVLGGALYMGRLHKDGRHFLRAHREALATVSFAVFAMGPGKLEEPELESSRKQLARELAKLPDLRPVSTTVFGGVIDPAKLHFPFDHMPAADARDWAAIQSWADELAAADLPARAPAEAHS